MGLIIIALAMSTNVHSFNNAHKQSSGNSCILDCSLITNPNFKVLM